MPVLDQDDVPSAIRQTLLEPLKSGDPVFSVVIAKELVLSPFIEACLLLLGVRTPSKQRVLLCEIIFCLCKCMAAECRLFVASVLPTLLWAEWALDYDKAEMETDQSALEIAIMAAYQQDLNIQPTIAPTRTPSLSVPSIYSRPELFALLDPNEFPMNVEVREVVPESGLMPTSPITKVDDRSRLMVYYRLCRVFHDNLSRLPPVSLITYAMLIERLSVAKSPIRSDAAAQIAAFLKSKELDATKDQVAADLLDVFYSNQEEVPKRRFPANESLILAWADALVSMSFTLPCLAQAVSGGLRQRARMEALPLAILALK